MHKLDSLGRRDRLRPQSTGKRITPQERDLLWFQKLLEHGPLPSSFLLQYAKETHRSEKRAKERLTDLFNEDNTPDGGPYLTRPPQQFRTIDSRYNQLVYDLGPAAKKALKRKDAWNEREAARSGPWLHGHMVSCITASIELATRDRDDMTFIPQSYLLERAEADLRYTTTISDPATGRTCKKDLIPDALFGLQYETPEGRRFRCFVVEADRSTEPATSKSFNRKSWLRSLLQYEAYLPTGAYREHLRLKAPLLVLNVTTDAKRSENMMDLMSRDGNPLSALMLFQAWGDFGAVFRPPQPNRALLHEAWDRADRPALRID